MDPDEALARMLQVTAIRFACFIFFDIRCTLIFHPSLTSHRPKKMRQRRRVTMSTTAG